MTDLWPRAAVVVTAAGRSSRMGGAQKKEYRSLDGKPVLAHAIAPFLLHEPSELIITVPPGDMDCVKSLLAPYMPAGLVLTTVEGGRTRQESVLRALRALRSRAPELVLIHDGARPWASEPLVAAVLEAAARFGACVPVVELTEAVKETDAAGWIVRHVPRHTIRIAQTPQGFVFASILSAHERAAQEGAACVDDAEVFALFGGPVATVPGDAANRKITFAHDLVEQA